MDARSLANPCTVLLAPALALFASMPAGAQCPAEAQLRNDGGGAGTTCDCFIPGEQAGAVLTPPVAHFPIEILEVGVFWASHLGGSPSTLEQALHVYAGGLPDPGAPIFTLPGPTLHDGMMNVFDLEPQPGRIVVQGGPVTVSVEFLNQNSNSPFAPSVVYDLDGCQAGKNVVFVQPGGWNDACPLGVPGDFVFFLEYRRLNCREATRLLLSPAAAGDLRLDWTASCGSTDTDYRIYEGTLGSFSGHQAHTCTTSGTTSATITPGSGSTYYLVVPTDGTTEGSYGKDSAAAERTPGTLVCGGLSQQTCP